MAKINQKTPRYVLGGVTIKLKNGEEQHFSGPDYDNYFSGMLKDVELNWPKQWSSLVVIVLPQDEEKRRG